MILSDYPDFQLSYCSNIHPGESLDEVLFQLKNNVPELKRRLSPEKPFGIGLRLSAKAAGELLAGNRLDEFKNWLKQEDLYVFTMNGFPYGSFHGARVKEQVYEPDWSTPERVRYSINLATILSRLLPDGSEGSISTSPLSYKFQLDAATGSFRMKDEAQLSELYRESVENLAKVVWEMAQIKKQSGVFIHLDIEPEPDCVLENSDETIAFFSNELIPNGIRYLSREHTLSSDEAERMLRDHIQICYDTCHFAVEYEQPEAVLEKFKQAGIGIGKLQISSALKVSLSKQLKKREKTARQLQSFVESTYLHQVVEQRNDGSFYQFRDLSEALPDIMNPDACEWRIHFHIPVFTDSFDGLQSTREDIIRSLDILKEYSFTRHLEVETYTWEVLPDGLKTELLESIDREMRWTLENFVR